MQRPLIATAARLAPYLSNVLPLAHNGYAYSADPPCHESKSRNSFQFGDDPRGGVKLGCWSVGCQSQGWVQRIENRLGIRIQINIDGKLTHQGIHIPGYAAPGSTFPRKPPAQHKRIDRELLPATPAAGPVTLDDWWNAPIWFVGAGRHMEGKHAATWQAGGKTWTCRHSKPPKEGGLRLARFGGELLVGSGHGQMVQPWASYSAIASLIAATPVLVTEERRPCCSLAGDPETPYPLPIGCIDADFHPEQDPDGVGRAFLNGVKAELISAGCPVFSSTSGNGFHAPWVLRAWPDGKVYAMVEAGKRVRAWPHRPGAHYHGARIEIFAPGDKKLIALWRSRPVANTDPETVIPELGYIDLSRILKAARGDI